MIPAKPQYTDKDWNMPETNLRVKEDEFVNKVNLVVIEDQFATLIKTLKNDSTKSRELSLMITKLEEALLWLQRHFDLTNEN